MYHDLVSAYISLNDKNHFQELYNGIGWISIYSAFLSKALNFRKDIKSSKQSGSTMSDYVQRKLFMPISISISLSLQPGKPEER
jgi:hypothetical protein